MSNHRWLIKGLFCVAALPVFAAKPDPSEQEIATIIQKFAAKEAEFATARENYTYRQTVRLNEFEPGGVPGGRFMVVADIIFTPAGKRVERVVQAPVPTLRLIQMTPEDEQDLRNVLPFVLTSKEIDNYHVRYLGHQNVDEIPCYVFAVKPKKMDVGGQRYFQGQIWVDDRDLQIVKTYGRSTGVLKKNSDQQFPKFETYREQIDGKYWFPTYTTADSNLHFQTGTVRLKMTVKYEDYKQFKSDVKIMVVDSEIKPAEETPSAPPAPPKPAPGSMPPPKRP